MGLLKRMRRLSPYNTKPFSQNRKFYFRLGDNGTKHQLRIFLSNILSRIFFASTFLLLCKAFFLENYPDFNVFYGGLTAYLQGGNPYVDVTGSVMKFLYPPFALFFFFPLLIFSRPVASVVWVGFSIVLLLLSIIFLFKIEKKKLWSPEFFLLSGLGNLMFTIKFNLGMGQFNHVNLFLIVLFLFFLDKKKDVLAACSLGLSLLLKVLPVLFILYLLILKKWKILAYISGIIIFGLLLPFLFIKSQIIIYFFTTSFTGTLESWPLDYYNQALSGFLGRSFGTGEKVAFMKQVISVFFILITCSVLWIKRTEKKAILLGFATLLPLTLITLSFSWQHYFVLTIPTLLLLYFHYQKRRANKGWFVALFISYLLIGSNIRTPGEFPEIIVSHMLWGTLLLWVLALYEIYRYY